jgi:uncharacterized protein (DUF2235 family)
MKRIVLLSDGTGNAAAKVWRTNVWRTFEGIDLSESDQVAFYDDGVGTSSFKPLAMIGGAFGYGLKRNVLDIYKFLCRNYRSKADYAGKGIVSESDEIYAFGFSRGAFTIRTVTGLVADQGLVVYQSETELEIKAKAAYRQYRSDHFHTLFRIEALFRWVRNLFVQAKHDKTQRPIDHITFLGLWDTVAAYGLPIDEMARGVSRYLFPLELPNRKLSPKVDRACHALSLDDERTTFHPVLWDETNEPKPTTNEWKTSDERVTQVWFAGVHANVGGGYPDDSLACVPLTWIMQEAAQKGLRFKSDPNQEPDAQRRSRSAADKDGRLYDSRSGIGGYYRYGPRDVYQLCHSRSDDSRENVNIDLPKIHYTALDRIKVNANLYAPIGLPEECAIVDAGRIVTRQSSAAYESPLAAKQRRNDQELVWNTVWRRRVIYFLSVFASVYLVAYPVFWIVKPYAEASTKLRIVADFIGFIGAALPMAVNRWPRAYASNPIWFLEWVVIVSVLLFLGAKLKASITDNMRSVWNRSLCGGPAPTIVSVAESSKAWFVTWLGVLFISLYLLIDPTAQSVFTTRLAAWIKGESSFGAINWVRTYVGSTFETIPSILKSYMTRGIAFLAAVTAIANVLPDRFVQALRTCRAYRNTLWLAKMWLAPAFFSIGFLYLLFAVPNHILLNFRDGMGWLCRASTPRDYLKRDQSKTFYFDVASNKEIDGETGSPKAADAKPQFCFGTGIIAERGSKYTFMIETAPGSQELQAGKPTSARIPRWTFFGSLSSMGGVSMGGIRQAYPRGELPVTKREIAGLNKRDQAIKDPEKRINEQKVHTPTKGEEAVRAEMQGVWDGFFWWQKIVAVILYPFKRSLDRPLGSVIVRFGPEGNEESFIDPDSAARNERQSEDLYARRDGELFIYTNKPISGLWGTE